LLIECILLVASLCQTVKDKPVMFLAAAQTSMQIADGITTRESIKLGGIETEPIPRLLLGPRPTWNRMAPLGATQIILATMLAHKMRESHNRFIHSVWWLPQCISIGDSTGGTIQNIGVIHSFKKGK
jgi:hypothetical protein